MRALAIIGTLAVLLVGGAITVAAAPVGSAPAAHASPSPSAHARPSPSAHPRPSAIPAPSSSSSGSSTGTAGGGPWQATLQPLEVISGNVKLTENSDGTGTLNLDTSGLGGSSPWHVYLDKGRVTNSATAANHEFAFAHS